MSGLLDLLAPCPETPAQFLRKQLGWHDRSFRQKPENLKRIAAAMQVSRQTLYEILKDRRSVTPDLALRFEQVYSISAVDLMVMKTHVDLWRCRQEGSGLYDGLTVVRSSINHSVLIHSDECVFERLGPKNWAARYSGDRFPSLKAIGLSQIGRCRRAAFQRLRRCVADRTDTLVKQYGSDLS